VSSKSKAKAKATVKVEGSVISVHYPRGTVLYFDTLLEAQAAAQEYNELRE